MTEATITHLPTRPRLHAVSDEGPSLSELIGSIGQSAPELISSVTSMERLSDDGLPMMSEAFKERARNAGKALLADTVRVLAMLGEPSSGEAA